MIGEPFISVVDLYFTPIEIVPAPGAGKYIGLIFADLLFNVSAGAYANIDSPNHVVLLSYGDWLSSASINSSMPLGNANSLALLTRYTAVLNNEGYRAPEGLLSNFENRPLKLFVDNSLGDFTDGHADNTLKVTVYYLIVDL